MKIVCIRPPDANVYHKNGVMDSLCHTISSTFVCDAFNNTNDKIVNIVCDGKAITNDLRGEIVCDVHANGNVFLGATVWDVYTNANV